MSKTCRLTGQNDVCLFLPLPEFCILKFECVDVHAQPLLVHVLLGWADLREKIFFSWLDHCKMSYYYPSSHESIREVVYFLLRYSMICVMTLLF